MPALRMLLRALLVFQCANVQVCHLCSFCCVLLFYSQTCHVVIEFCKTKETLHQDKNYAAKFPTFGEIVGVNRPAVQWNSLVLGELPP